MILKRFNVDCFKDTASKAWYLLCVRITLLTPQCSFHNYVESDFECNLVFKFVKPLCFRT